MRENHCLQIPSSPTGRNKAVPDGAVSFYLDHFVSVRVSRFTYGSDMAHWFDKTNPEHVSREHLIFTTASGEPCVANGFCSILTKVIQRVKYYTRILHQISLQGTQVSETTEFRQLLWHQRRLPWELDSLTSKIRCYRGESKDPQWMDAEPGALT